MVLSGGCWAAKWGPGSCRTQGPTVHGCSITAQVDQVFSCGPDLIHFIRQTNIGLLRQAVEAVTYAQFRAWAGPD